MLHLHHYIHYINEVYMFGGQRYRPRNMGGGSYYDYHDSRVERHAEMIGRIERAQAEWKRIEKAAKAREKEAREKEEMQRIERIAADKEAKRQANKLAHIQLISLAETNTFKQLAQYITSLNHLKLEADDKDYLPQDAKDQTVFNAMYKNAKLDSDMRLQLLSMLSTKGYDVWSYCLSPFVVEMTDPLIVATYYNFMLNHEKDEFKLTNEKLIWKVFAKLDEKTRTEQTVNIINSMIKHLSNENGIVRFIEFIDFNIHACKTPEETLKFYNQCSALITKFNNSYDFDTDFKKMAKLHLLSLEMQAKQKTERATEVKESSVMNKAEIVEFLNTRRPSLFQYFTQRRNTTSMNTHIKIQENKLTEAQEEIENSRLKNEKAIKNKAHDLLRKMR